MFVYFIKNYKNWLWISLGLALTAGIADFTSSTIIKKSVERPRPCHTFSNPAEINLRVHCGGGYSFPSSHATNHFAIAFFLILLFKNIWKRSLKFTFFIWAFSISFAQIYVGVHYPIDILAGSILGTFIGSFMVIFLMKNKENLLEKR